ncbi:nitroreductase family protein [Pontibaca salina]|uniref:Putative NAD(P)H nitroreductase n=1 Tax=Pontibaca salina TaxID=2795731 RepID=A0A934HRK4_9RHOB|nr:nitroreductase [Pontibaca salina]MBI6629265.1 nitroreductase [Pontibaca salina]
MTSDSRSAIDFLLTRRSRPAKTLQRPVPTRDDLMPILTAAARCPDHGRLEPWRFIVIEGAAMARLAKAVQKRGEALDLDESQIAKGRSQFDQGNLAVAVVEIQRDSEKIPAIEQTYSAGAACLSLLNAALASGWGANWLTGWAAHDQEFCATALGLASNEGIVGFVHIGTERITPTDRTRPDVAAITQWLDE